MPSVSSRTCPLGRTVCPHGEWLGLLVVSERAR